MVTGRETEKSKKSVFTKASILVYKTVALAYKSREKSSGMVL